VLYEAGGDFSTSNMTTWDDRITMYDTLPADRLETTMKINADRLRRGLILDEERKPEMTVVRNEYERGENDPEQALFKAVNAAAIVAHPYHWDTIGYRSDIEGVSTEQLRRHYDAFFWPDNATAVLVGDFDKRAALAMFQREFGGFSKAPAPIPQVVTTEPPQEGERRVIVRRAGAVPIVQIAWLRPGAADPQYAAFDVLDRSSATASPHGSISGSSRRGWRRTSPGRTGPSAIPISSRSRAPSRRGPTRRRSSPPCAR
jgi:zinc protease